MKNSRQPDCKQMHVEMKNSREPHCELLHLEMKTSREPNCEKMHAEINNFILLSKSMLFERSLAC